jgi:hypothetical protein
MSNSRRRILAAASTAAAAAALVLMPATSASALKPEPFTVPFPVNFYDVFDDCAADPALADLTLTVFTVNNFHESKDGSSFSTPGLERLTFTNADGQYITIQDANQTTHTITGDNSETIVRSGLQWRVVDSSTGTHPEVHSAGRLVLEYTYAEDGVTKVVVSQTGRAGADLCAAAIDALSS